MYILLNILCCSIWTSYAFKAQNIDLAVINVFRKSALLILNSLQRWLFQSYLLPYT